MGEIKSAEGVLQHLQLKGCDMQNMEFGDGIAIIEADRKAVIAEFVREVIERMETAAKDRFRRARDCESSSNRRKQNAVGNALMGRAMSIRDLAREKGIDL